MNTNTNTRPAWNVKREKDAEAWARRVDSETLAAMLSGKVGTTYWHAAKQEWNRRFPVAAS